MLYQATTKVPGGKLIRTKVEADAVINAVQIGGDFFLHPEESLTAVEKSLVGQAVPSGPADQPAHEAQLAMLIHGALAREKAAFLGVSPEDIARTVVKALSQPQLPVAENGTVAQNETVLQNNPIAGNATVAETVATAANQPPVAGIISV